MIVSGAFGGVLLWLAATQLFPQPLWSRALHLLRGAAFHGPLFSLDHDLRRHLEPLDGRSGPRMVGTRHRLAARGRGRLGGDQRAGRFRALPPLEINLRRRHARDWWRGRRPCGSGRAKRGDPGESETGGESRPGCKDPCESGQFRRRYFCRGPVHPDRARHDCGDEIHRHAPGFHLEAGERFACSERGGRTHQRHSLHAVADRSPLRRRAGCGRAGNGVHHRPEQIFAPRDVSRPSHPGISRRLQPGPCPESFYRFRRAR